MSNIPSKDISKPTLSIYNTLTSQLLNDIYNKFDNIFSTKKNQNKIDLNLNKQRNQNNQDKIDLDLNNNVITCRIENIGEYVINKQPSIYEIWLSSPISGPSKYKLKMDNNFKNKHTWLSKCNKNIINQLNREIEQIEKMV
ncbi:Frataxin [Spraguea lophii 42_110]|uniref:Frataxin n=1 Tax=Spraguea lophii (strain 42_110) TaxID=1358809 RepID=S7WAE7_SPRLO|nr:Frataxin [Spraguea lophii 42_110]